MHELKWCVATTNHPERRMARDVSALLFKDPFVQSTGVFVGSFFITVLIQPSQVPLKFFHAASAGVVCTNLSIEVKKSSHSFPCMELFYRIRRSYLDGSASFSLSFFSDSFVHSSSLRLVRRSNGSMLRMRRLISSAPLDSTKGRSDCSGSSRSDCGRYHN